MHGLTDYTGAPLDVDVDVATERRIKSRVVARPRRYLPTLPDLVDRLSIVQMKAVFIPEHASEYRQEMADIIYDIQTVLLDAPPMSAVAVRACLLIMLTNRFIWENESIARAGGDGHDKRLKLTHSINGVRNTAKNVLAAEMGGRRDYKVDCFASDLPAEFGNWNVFTDIAGNSDDDKAEAGGPAS